MRREDFYNYVSVDDTSGCHNWVGCLFKDGYGNVRIDGKKRRAHRVAYEIYVGEIPLKLQVLHKCDNRRCVNPAHLWVGTHKENMLDMRLKGRAANGERIGNSKLSKDKVAEIRLRVELGVPRYIISQEFKLTSSHLSKILKNQIWRLNESY